MASGRLPLKSRKSLESIHWPGLLESAVLQHFGYRHMTVRCHTTAGNTGADIHRPAGPRAGQRPRAQGWELVRSCVDKALWLGPQWGWLARLRGSEGGYLEEKLINARHQAVILSIQVDPWIWDTEQDLRGTFGCGFLEDNVRSAKRIKISNTGKTSVER